MSEWRSAQPAPAGQGSRARACEGPRRRRPRAVARRRRRVAALRARASRRAAAKGRGASRPASSRQFASRGAGRTGRIAPTGRGTAQAGEDARRRAGRGPPGRARAADRRQAQGPRGVGGHRLSRARQRDRRPTSSRSPAACASRCRRSTASGSRPRRAARRRRASSPTPRRCWRPTSPSCIKRRPGTRAVPRRRRRCHRSRQPRRAPALLRRRRRAVASCCPATAPCTSRRPSPRPRPAPSSTCRWRSSAGCPRRWPGVKDAGIWVIGLDDGADRDLFDIGDLAVEGVCLVLGAEGAGPVAPGARALRPDRQHPDARPAQLAQRQRRRRTGHLRDRPPPPPR